MYTYELVQVEQERWRWIVWVPKLRHIELCSGFAASQADAERAAQQKALDLESDPGQAQRLAFIAILRSVTK